MTDMDLLRKILLTLCLMAGMAVGISAQRYYTPDFSVGVKGGATISQMQFMPNVRQSMTPGYTFGLMVRYTEEKLFGLVGELNVTQRGWAEDFKGAHFSYSRHLTYLQLPLLTQIRFGWNRAKIIVNLGPEAGYMLSNSIKADFDYKHPDEVANFPKNRHTEQMSMKVHNRFDYGIAGGLGAELFLDKAKRNSLLLEGRFYFGIGNIFKASRVSTFSASRGISVEVTLGYFFRIV